MSKIEQHQDGCPRKIYVIYASQTGQAESISEFIFNLFTSPSGPLRTIYDRLGGTEVQRHCISTYETELLDPFFIPSSSSSSSSNDNVENDSYLAIMVASTTGQGDPPDNALKFFRWMKRLKRSHGNEHKLKHVRYALLGLGDTNYDNFANFAHLLDRHLMDLGAKPYVPTCYADDAVGLELVTEPFVENLQHTLLQQFDVKEKIQVSPLTITLKKKEVTADENKTEEKSNLETSGELTNIVETKKETNEIDELNIEEMNLNRPVVSSCIALNGFDKIELSELCRYLLEPSEQLFNVSTESLSLPKITYSIDEHQFEACVYVRLDALVEQRSKLLIDNVDDHGTKIVSTLECLQAKVPKDCRLYQAQNENDDQCCHQTKNVLQCNVEFRSESKSVPDFVPGDAYGIYCSNLMIDLYQILTSLIVRNEINQTRMVSLWDYVKKIVDLFQYLVYCIDLRTIPKKVALCHLAEYTTDVEQRRRLLELSSREGNVEYQKLILAHKITMCDILRMFDTCHPPINVFLNYLNGSKPRYFSVATVPRLDNNDDQCEMTQFKIIFSVATDFTHSFMRSSEHLLGLLSGKFFKHYSVPSLSNMKCDNIWPIMEMIHQTTIDGTILDKHDIELIDNQHELNFDVPQFPAYIFPRINHSFRIVHDHTKPLILISTGTGIAPFFSLLEQRSKYESDCGEIYFFFGCRHPNTDFIKHDHLLSYTNGPNPLIKHLCLCFSRCNNLPLLERFQSKNDIRLCDPTCKHVDELISIHGEQLIRLIVDLGAYVYICGDWKRIAPCLGRKFTYLISEFILNDTEPNETSPEAVKIFKQWQKDGRYMIDIWT
ncbi:hypothetical protein RDWZM_009972 [Blomia tropicalis]|uniref:Methionine synthase reductase n=1 Tax=Blomia tropicalis TaxID=40697 RepID=A0A9Q0M024_BLOTA|nr:hypothetical protein RDWZM_009972 [Blomia tropicalis]